MKINDEILNVLQNRRFNAESKANKNIQIAYSNEDFKLLSQQKSDLIIQSAKLEITNQDNSQVEKLIAEINSQMKKVLKNMNMTFDDLQPKFLCNNCKDKGYINGEKCSCYYDLFSKITNKYSNIDLKDIPFIDNYSVDLFNDKEEATKVLNFTKKYIDTFPNDNVINLTFCGTVGSGKSYLSKVIAKEIIQKNYSVLYQTSFSLNKTFSNIHYDYDIDKMSALNELFNIDLLIIDDLGTEPIIKNVTNEYLFLLINERTNNSKHTIINSNLTIEGLLDRYDERFVSRVFNKRNSKNILFNNLDLRLKNSYKKYN